MKRLVCDKSRAAKGDLDAAAGGNDRGEFAAEPSGNAGELGEEKAMVSELSSKGIGEVTGKKPTGNGVPRAKTKSGSKPVKAPKLRKPAKRSRKEQAELVKQAAATLTAAGYPAGESLLKKRQKARG